MKSRSLMFLLLFWSQFILAQRYSFDKITSSQGLSQSTVLSIIQDRKGFMWLGSMDGLNRYDGYTFKVYRNVPEDSSSLSNSEIRSIFEDSKGRLWIGMVRGGINIFDRNTGKCQRLNHVVQGQDLSYPQFNGFAEDRQGNIWVASSEGLYKIDPQLKIQRIALNRSREFTAILYDSQGRLWVGSENGLIYRQKKTGSNSFETFSITKNTSNHYHLIVRFLLEDEDGRMLAGTNGNGIFEYRPASKKFSSLFYFPKDFERRNVTRAAVKDNNGRIWAGSDAGLLLIEYKAGKYQLVDQVLPDLKHKKGLNNHSIQTLCLDSFGNLWIGMWQGDVNVMYSKAGHFDLINTENGLPVNKTMGVAVYNKDIWVATRTGVTRFSANLEEIEQVLSNKDITALQVNKQHLFVASWDEGFYLIDPRTRQMKRYYTQDKNPNCVYFRINVAHLTDQALWMGDSEGAIYYFDFARQKIIAAPNGYIGVSTTSIVQGDEHSVWVGTYGGGLWHYDIQTAKLEHFNLSTLPHSPPNQNHVNALMLDAQHNIWVGTNGGLFKIARSSKKVQYFSTLNGLPSNVIHSIVQDAKGTFWIATNEGICRFNEAKKSVRTYNLHDGLSGKEFISNALHRSDDGRIFFGGIHGMNYFHPDSIQDHRLTPKVYVTKLLLLNRKVKPNQLHTPLERNIEDVKTFTLSYADAASITFEYVGLYYQRNNQCTYACKLEGFDQHWNNLGDRRSATYTNLNPGTYRFWVKAANSDGVWNEQGSFVDFKILPPWYLTIWAYLLYALLIVMGLLVYRNFVRNREALKAKLRLKELEAENLQHLDQFKTNFFTNISHEFRTPLTLILDPVNTLIKEPQLPEKRVKEWYSIIRYNAQRLLRLINQLLDLSKLDSQKYQLHLEYLDIVDLCAKVVHLFDFHFEKHGVDLVFTTEPEEFYGWFDPDALDKILNNLISNALKATPAKGRVSITIQGVAEHEGIPRHCIISIKDTGVGIPKEQVPHIFKRFFQANPSVYSGQVGTGVGLALSAELLRLHQGKIEVESEVGLGTLFTLNIPLEAKLYPKEWKEKKQEQDWQFKDSTSESSAMPLNNQITPSTNGTRLHERVVIIAEDNLEMRNYLQQKLAEHYRVYTFENGREAFESALECVPDIVVSDLLMPEMNGIELCKALKENEKTCHIPLILLTSRSVVESQLEGLKSGADDYLTKPFNSEILLARINNLLEQRQLLRELYSKKASGSSLIIPDIPISDTDEHFLQKAIAVIDANLSNLNFSVGELEKALNMSEMQLYRKLQSLTNMGGNAFIRHIRLKRADQLLENSNLSIGEIAYKVGFNSHSYFSKIYKREFGRSPASLKKG